MNKNQIKPGMLERDEVDIVVGDLAVTQGRNEVEY